MIPTLDNAVIDGILIGLSIFLTAYVLKKVVHWFFRKLNLTSDDKNRTIETLLKSVLNYLALICFVIYLLMPYVNITDMLAGAGVIGILLGIILRSVVKDIFIGLIRLYEKQFIVGDFVTINGVYRGEIVNIRVRFITIREWSGNLFMINHNRIEMIHKHSRDQMNITERIVVHYQENPEKVSATLKLVCERATVKYKRLLQVDQDGRFIQPFELYGITAVNKNYYGVEYLITGIVKSEYYFEAAKVIRYEIIKAMHDAKIKTGSDFLGIN